MYNDADFGDRKLPKIVRVKSNDFLTELNKVNTHKKTRPQLKTDKKATKHYLHTLVTHHTNALNTDQLRTHNMKYTSDCQKKKVMNKMSSQS